MATPPRQPQAAPLVSTPRASSAGPIAMSADAVCHYRRLRRDGLLAVHAYRRATATIAAPRYRSGPGEAITLLLDQYPGAAGFSATAVAEYDEDLDLFGLGRFSDTRTSDTVQVRLDAERSRHTVHADRYGYFVPSYTLAQRRADLVRCGYARGPAHEFALRQVREDARLARRLEARFVHVTVRKAGVLLGEAGMCTAVSPEEDLDAAMAEVIGEYGLLDEALARARTALLPLIAALAA